MEEFIEIQDEQVCVALGNTLLICDNCQRVDAVQYKVKRSGGKYVLLCDDELQSCAMRDIVPNCSYMDHENVTCTQLADFEIWPQDGPFRKIIYACPLHAGILLINGKNEVYPIAKVRQVD